MRTHELARQLMLRDDRDVEISVDISNDEKDMDDRVFATPLHVQFDAVSAMIISTGDFNDDARKHYGVQL